jgi:hypothetical protein
MFKISPKDNSYEQGIVVQSKTWSPRAKYCGQLQSSLLVEQWPEYGLYKHLLFQI